MMDAASIPEPLPPEGSFVVTIADPARLIDGEHDVINAMAREAEVGADKFCEDNGVERVPGDVPRYSGWRGVHGGHAWVYRYRTPH